MTDYIRVLGGCFPSAEAYVPPGGDPTVYDDLVWVTAPILQADLDVSPCNTEIPPIPREVEIAEIESMAAGPVGKLFEIPFQRNGSVSNDWLLTDDLPTNQTPVIVPFDCKLVALSFANRDDGSKTELEIKSVPEGSGSSPSTLKLTWILDDVRTARKSNFSTEITFNQGDKIAVFAKKRGSQVDPKDVKMVIHLIAISAGESEVVEDWEGNIT